MVDILKATEDFLVLPNKIVGNAIFQAARGDIKASALYTAGKVAGTSLIPKLGLDLAERTPIGKKAQKINFTKTPAKDLPSTSEVIDYLYPGTKDTGMRGSPKESVKTVLNMLTDTLGLTGTVSALRTYRDVKSGQKSFEKLVDITVKRRDIDLKDLI